MGRFSKTNQLVNRLKKKRSVNARQTAAIKKNTKQIKNLKGLDETKFLDHITTTTVIDELQGNFFDMNALGPWVTNTGTSNDDRIRTREGNRVTTQSIQVNGFVYMPYETLTTSRNMTPTRCRIMFIQVFEQDPTQTVPFQASDFLTFPGGTGASPSLALSWVDALYKRNRTIKMKVLSDKTYTLEPHYYNYTNAVATGYQFSGLTATSPNLINIRTKISNKKMYNGGVIEWAQRSNNVNPYKGRIYMFTCADRDAGISLVQTKRHVFKDAM